MPEPSLLIPVALMMPPLFVSVLAGRFATRGDNTHKRFLIGAWISVVLAMLYYGLLAALAGINAVEREPMPGLAFIVLVLLGIVALLAAICFGVFWSCFRLFKRLGRKETRV